MGLSEVLFLMPQRQRWAQSYHRKRQAPLAVPLPSDPHDDPVAQATRPRSMPPPMAHKLSGVTEEPRRLTPQERRRQINKGIYKPYAPLYKLLGGRTIAHLARQVGVSPLHLSEVLRGFKEPAFFLGVRLCKALNLSMEDLDRWLSRVQDGPLY